MLLKKWNCHRSRILHISDDHSRDGEPKEKESFQLELSFCPTGDRETKEASEGVLT